MIDPGRQVEDIPSRRGPGVEPRITSCLRVLRSPMGAPSDQPCFEVDDDRLQVDGRRLARDEQCGTRVRVMDDQHQRNARLVRTTVALTRSLIDRLDERRRHEPDLPSRGELIRRLLEKALGAEAKDRERGQAAHGPATTP